MPEPERAKLFAVNGPNDHPKKGDKGITVQFNPTSLKVSLSNTLKANSKSGSSRATQYVDKSSSSLTVELIFDTSLTFESVAQKDKKGNEISRQDERTDVRTKTKPIAEKFLKPRGTGKKLRAPKRCLFQWGSFEFVGLVQSFDETLDFFGPEGTPLRATVALKLSEDRFQFRSAANRAADQQTPTLTSTGAGESGSPPTSESANANNQGSIPPAQPANSQDSNPVQNANSEAGEDQRDWRNTSMYNGIESPRLPSSSALAVPKISAKASMNASISAGAVVSTGAGLSTSATASLTPPAFKFGASASLGSGISGTFSADAGVSGGVSASSIISSGGTALRKSTSLKSSASIESGSSVKIRAVTGVGFD